MTRVGKGFVYSGQTVDTLPKGSIPVKMHLGNLLITRGLVSRIYPSVKSWVPSEFLGFIDNLDEWEKELLQDVQFDEDIFLVAQYFHNSVSDPNLQIYATSDRSAPDFVGKFSWACKSTK